MDIEFYLKNVIGNDSKPTSENVLATKKRPASGSQSQLTPYENDLSSYFLRFENHPPVRYTAAEKARITMGAKRIKNVETRKRISLDQEISRLFMKGDYKAIEDIICAKKAEKVAEDMWNAGHTDEWSEINDALDTRSPEKKRLYGNSRKDKIFYRMMQDLMNPIRPDNQLFNP